MCGGTTVVMLAVLVRLVIVVRWRWLPVTYYLVICALRSVDLKLVMAVVVCSVCDLCVCFGCACGNGGLGVVIVVLGMVPLVEAVAKRWSQMILVVVTNNLVVCDH